MVVDTEGRRWPSPCVEVTLDHAEGDVVCLFGRRDRPGKSMNRDS